MINLDLTYQLIGTWKVWKQKWSDYTLLTQLHENPKEYQSAMLRYTFIDETINQCQWMNLSNEDTKHPATTIECLETFTKGIMKLWISTLSCSPSQERGILRLSPVSIQRIFPQKRTTRAEISATSDIRISIWLTIVAQCLLESIFTVHKFMFQIDLTPRKKKPWIIQSTESTKPELSSQGVNFSRLILANFAGEKVPWARGWWKSHK